MHRLPTRSLLPSPRPLLHHHPRPRPCPRPRLASTLPPHQRPRSWKSSAARWSLAAAGLYYYSTSTVFAEAPALYPPHLAGDEDSEAALPTLASLAPSMRPKAVITPVEETPVPPAPTPPPTTDTPSPSELEAEAEAQGAFNEETGEINWDCPCLGGMAHGPCGEEFRAAFSCFVYSSAEPKGMDCIERFKGMQECFRAHPEEYPAEMEEEDEGEDGDMDMGEENAVGLKRRPEEVVEGVVSEQGEVLSQDGKKAQARNEGEEKGAQARSKAAGEQGRKEDSVVSESEELVPKAAHDATGTGVGVSKAEGN